MRDIYSSFIPWNKGRKAGGASPLKRKFGKELKSRRERDVAASLTRLKGRAWPLCHALQLWIGGAASVPLPLTLEVGHGLCAMPYHSGLGARPLCRSPLLGGGAWPLCHAPHSGLGAVLCCPLSLLESGTASVPCPSLCFHSVF